MSWLNYKESFHCLCSYMSLCTCICSEQKKHQHGMRATVDGRSGHPGQPAQLTVVGDLNDVLEALDS